ncbi:MAG: hypothetical protein ABH859_05235 [Pseudomonadota bacterium]
MLNRTKKTTQSPKKPSAGYPEIEELIETEDFSEVNKKFQNAYDQLEELGKKKKGLKKSRDAKQAMLSIELVMELFRELLTIKYRLEELSGKTKSK